MIVAVVDTGYDSDHPELAGALWTNPAESCGSADTDGNGKAGDCHGWNFTTNSPDVDNGSYGTHGTSVSGVVGGRRGNGHGTAGVAPDVTIMPLVIGSGSSVDVVLGAEAIRYAVDHGADVINASWGGAFGGWALANLRSAVDYAAAHDVLVVAAAGNDAPTGTPRSMYPASLTEPNVVTVGNSDRRRPDQLAARPTAPTSVDLFAPGDLVFTTWNDGALPAGVRHVDRRPAGGGRVRALPRRLAGRDGGRARQALLDDADPVPAFAGQVRDRRTAVDRLAWPTARSARSATVHVDDGTGRRRDARASRAAGGDVSGDYSVTVGLGMEPSGEVWAVSDKELSLGGTTLTTDDAGEAVVRPRCRRLARRPRRCRRRWSSVTAATC